MKTIFYSKYIYGNGLNLFGFIILHEKLKEIPEKRLQIVRHERIHTKQMKGLLYLGFYLIYGLEFLVNLIRFRNAYVAYRGISFEIEAHRYQSSGSNVIEEVVDNYSWMYYLFIHPSEYFTDV